MSFCECKNIVRRVLHCLCHFASAVKDLYDEEVERLHNRGQAPPHKKNKGVKRRTWWAQKQGWVDPPKVPTQPREPPPPHLVVSSDDEQEAEQEGEYEYFDDDAYGQDQQQFDDDAYGQDEFDIVETPGVQIEELPPETCRLTRPLSHFSRLHTSQCVWCHTHTRLVSLMFAHVWCHSRSHPGVGGLQRRRMGGIVAKGKKTKGTTYIAILQCTSFC